LASNPLTLLADVGGTHARLALSKGNGPPGPAHVYATADYPCFTDLVRHFVTTEAAGLSIARAAACVAGPISDGVIRLTNLGWTIGCDELAASGAAKILIVNDFTAIAAALPALGGADLRACGGGNAHPDGSRVVLGPGTGLGVSALLPDRRGGHIALAGEGGHADLAAHGARERAVCERLAERFGRVSVERVLSGPGIVNLYRALRELDGGCAEEAPDPAAIAASARAGQDPHAVACVTLFTRWLGAWAGDLALSFGARGGVYIAGGIVPAWGPDFDIAGFRAAFEAKGRFEDYLVAIPCYVIDAPNPGLSGLAELLAGRVTAIESLQR